MRNGEENEGDSPVISEKKEEKEEDGDSVEINEEEEEERKYYRGNMVGQLQEYLMGRGLGVATYADGEITGPAHKLHFTMRASLGNVVEMGEGSTKKEAKVNKSQWHCRYNLMLAPSCWSTPGQDQTTIRLTC